LLAERVFVIVCQGNISRSEFIVSSVWLEETQDVLFQQEVSQKERPSIGETLRYSGEKRARERERLCVCVCVCVTPKSPKWSCYASPDPLVELASILASLLMW